MIQVFPSESSLLRLVGAVMCDQAETWSGSRNFSERKMAEMHDATHQRGASSRHDWAELEKTARKMNESGLKLADGVEAAYDIDRFQILDTGAKVSITPTFPDTTEPARQDA